VTAVALYFLAFAWGIVILLSLVGWGGVLNRLLFPKDQTDWGQRAAWGLSFSVVIGGVLNVLLSISRVTILVFLGFGFLAWIIGLLIGRPSPSQNRARGIPDLRRPKALIMVGFLIVALLALIRYAASVSVVRDDPRDCLVGLNCFSHIDDLNAYLVFPKKMLQVGSIGRDPFCSRRLHASLGGQSFLDTFVLSMFSIQHLHLIDRGLGVLVVIGLGWGIFREGGISPQWSLAAMLVFLLISPPAINNSSLYTGVALFLSLCRTLAWKAFPSSRLLSRSFISALIAAAICSLKSSFIPACGVLLACSFLCFAVVQRFRKAAIAELVTTGFMTIALMLPWMISMYQSSGTLLYPLLGRGYHQSVYGNSLSPYSEITIWLLAKQVLQASTEPLFVALISLGFFWLATRRPGIEGREPVLSLLLGATVGQVVMTLALNSYSLASRLSFPFVLAAVVGLMTEAPSSRSEVTGGRKKLAGSATVVVTGIALFLAGSAWVDFRTMYADCVYSVGFALQNKPLISDQETVEYEKLQQSIPPGEVLLARLGKPFLLDFKRNMVFLVDEADASPPPGMPFFEGSEALARYLTLQSIRYVAYSYKEGEQWRTRANILVSYTPWIRNMLWHVNDFQDNLIELAKTRRHVYDDGSKFVLDLQQGRTGDAAQDPSAARNAGR
jgi:hypothetical protein